MIKGNHISCFRAWVDRLQESERNFSLPAGQYYARSRVRGGVWKRSQILPEAGSLAWDSIVPPRGSSVPFWALSELASRSVSSSLCCGWLVNCFFGLAPYWSCSKVAKCGDETQCLTHNLLLSTLVFSYTKCYSQNVGRNYRALSQWLSDRKRE